MTKEQKRKIEVMRKINAEDLQYNPETGELILTKTVQCLCFSKTYKALVRVEIVKKDKKDHLQFSGDHVITDGRVMARIFRWLWNTPILPSKEENNEEKPDEKDLRKIKEIIFGDMSQNYTSTPTYILHCPIEPFIIQ